MAFFIKPILLLGFFSLEANSQLNIEVDNSQIDRSGMNFTESYASVLAGATPAVVSVTTQQFVKRILPGGGNPIEEFLRRYYGYPRLYQPRIAVSYTHLTLPTSDLV